MNTATTTNTPIHATAEALAIARAALDQGIFYQDAFGEACAPHWAEAFPVNATCITASGDRNWIEQPAGLPEGRMQREQLTAELKTKPRGSWSLVRREANGREFWEALITDGAGKVSAPQVSHLRREPTHEVVLKGMVAMEIYLARLDVEHNEKVGKARKALAESRWQTGQVLRGLRMGPNVYSSAVVTATNPNTGTVSLHLTRRGSRRRWEWTGPAYEVSIEEAPKAPVNADQDALLPG